MSLRKFNKFEWGWIAFVTWISYWAAGVVEDGPIVIALTLTYALVLGMLPILLLRGAMWIFRHASGGNLR